MGFPPTDPLFVSVTKAYHAVHDLSVRLHYLGCQSGVGEPEKPRWIAARMDPPSR